MYIHLLLDKLAIDLVIDTTSGCKLTIGGRNIYILFLKDYLKKNIFY